MADFEFVMLPPKKFESASESAQVRQNEGIRMQDTGTGQWYTYRNGAWWLDGEDIDE